MWMRKRWWAFTVILTLALSLTSCANKRKLQSLQLAGYNECNGYIPIEVGVEATTQANKFTLLVNALSITGEEPVMQLALAYAKPDDSLGGRSLQSQVVFEANSVIDSIVLSINDFSNPYSPNEPAYLVATPAYDASNNLIPWMTALQNYYDYSTVCELPYPGSVVPPGSGQGLR